MTKSIWIFLLSLFSICCSSSCTEDASQEQVWTFKKVNALLDSVQAKELIAIYKEALGYSFIVKNNRTDSLARKLTCVAGFPIIVDSLFQTGVHQFKSKRLRTQYVVNDSEVIVTFFQKIIHPSSNWQGQTPWQEIIISNYPRLDGKLK